jgi:hypothetical protein
MSKDRGKLFYNNNNDRMGIKFNNGTIEDGLHCGNTFEVNIKGKWIPTRIEMTDDWYLVGIKGLNSLEGLEVRI